MAYIYQADVWCDTCGEAIKNRLRFENTSCTKSVVGDSDEWPQSYDPDYEESDSPQHCGSGTCAGDHGTFLQNRLTREGYQGLKARLDKAGENLSPVLQEQAEFYGFSYWRNPYESPQDWLTSRITELAAAGTIPGHDAGVTLVSWFRDLIGAVSADDIQDLFQSNMDSDDYFKKPGWYSDEMEGC